jgi:hypothetical protein
MPASIFPANPAASRIPVEHGYPCKPVTVIVLILIYIKYTKKCGFDNYAAL